MGSVRFRKISAARRELNIVCSMSIEEIHAEALQLPEDERAKLAGVLLDSLPALLVDDDEGIAEARRRSRDLNENPGQGVTWDDIKRTVNR